MATIFFLTKVIDWNDNASSSDENDSGSDKKDKKHAAKMISTVMIWRVRRTMTVSLLTQVTKKRDMKETRSKIEE